MTRNHWVWWIIFWQWSAAIRISSSEYHKQLGRQTTDTSDFSLEVLWIRGESRYLAFLQTFKCNLWRNVSANLMVNISRWVDPRAIAIQMYVSITPGNLAIFVQRRAVSQFKYLFILMTAFYLTHGLSFIIESSVYVMASRVIGQLLEDNCYRKQSFQQ